ncbi:polyketide synthase [Fusarium agapanthi]|uniref:Polyketide synthase n=1 Tax=Fusarium agapanthi TaxID=1803897 RepID=A0A9P5BC52_9HYPO|nr:polyketide synthase [Fusarium agapanthi]
MATVDLDGPALAPPKGEVSNLNDPPNQNGLAYTVLIICAVITTICFLLRAYGRVYLLKKFQTEEILTTLAYGNYWGAAYATFKMVDTPGYFVHQWNVCLKDVIPTNYATSNTAIVVALNMQCNPHEAIWDFRIPGAKCWDLHKLQVASATIHLCCDIAIFLLPQQVIWKLKMSWKKRMGVPVIFGLGLLACVSATFRLAVTVKYGKAADALYALAPLVFWATAEMTCGFFIVCVPCIPKILKETGVIRNIKRAFGMSTAPTNPNTADRYAKNGTKGSQLSSTGPKSYYKLDEDGVPLGTLKGSESTEYLRDNANNGQGTTRTTQIKITQDNRATSDSVSYELSDIGYGRGQDRPREASAAADVADGPGLEVLSIVLGLALDPMQRWTLEATYHAFENAGLPADSLKGSRTAVFSVSMLEGYSRMTAVDPENLERTAVTGSTASCIIPNRVSRLSAVDMACKALKSGDASCAVVTGANLLLDPSIFQHVQAVIENGDMIRAVIRSIGSNQGGHTPILTQPSSQSQEELIRHVYKQEGLAMSDTRYVEAHGTRTPVGDPIEDRSLSGIHNTSLIPRPVTNGSGVTNGHGAAHTNGANGTNGVANGHSDAELHKLLVWTAADEKAAKRTMEAYDNFHKEKMSGDHKKLDSLAFTLGSRRSNMLWRGSAVVDGSKKQALSPSKPIRSSEDLGLAFVFTGQGSQYINMGSGLEHYAVYRETLEKISEIYSDFGCSWNLFGNQPLATAVQIALVDLLTSFRITPKVIIGHSSGEIAAAYVSGGLSLESACRVSYSRGVPAGKPRETNVSSPGAMLSIKLAPHHVLGPLNADQDGIFAQKLKTGAAYHSQSMKVIAGEYLAALEGLTKRKDGTSIPMVSSVTGKSISPETLSTCQYWVENMLSPVRFAEVVQVIANNNSARKLGLGNITDMIEIGPHPALRRPVKDTPSEMSSASKGTTLELAGQLFCEGYPVSILAANQQRTKAKFLVDCRKGFRLREAVKGELLGARVSDWNSLEPRWRNFWSIDSSAWTGDHKTSDTVLFPASGMLLMAIEAAQEMVPSDRAVFGYKIEKAEFMNPIIVPETWEDRLETQVRLRVVDKQLAAKFDVSIFTYSHNEWVECFAANISVEFQDNDSNGERRVSDEHIQRQHQDVAHTCTLPIDPRVFYLDAAAVGLQYGDWFQLMHNIKWDDKTSAVARVDLSQARFNISSLVHPAVLDQAFQVLRASSGQQPAANVPVRLENTWFSSKAWKTPPVQWMCSAIPTVHGYGEQGKVTALGEDGEVLCCIERAVTSAVSSGITHKEKKLVYSIEWKPQFSMLGPDTLTHLCAANAVPKDDSAVLENHSKLCHALELAAARVLRGVDKSKVPADLQRHVEWMEHHVSKLSSENQDEAMDISDEELESRLAEVDSVLPADVFYSDLFRNLCADGQLNYLLDLVSHENLALRVLEVGAGTGGMTGHVILALQEREKRTGGLAFSEYTYTDISPAFFETASQRWPDLNIDSQGFDPGSYDLVIAASVLHATPYLEATIRTVRKALKPGGRLILLEVINPDDITTNFMAGLVPGWWVAREEWRPHSAAIPEPLWDECLKDNEFSGKNLDLDFFILLSSLAGVVEQMASANYAGGCAYQDTLAKHRRSRLQNALSLDIGWMSNIGIIAEKEAYQRQRQTSNDMQPIDDKEERQRAVIRAMAAKLARAMSISPDDVEPSKPLSLYGVDSLMAVELRNWINKEFSSAVAVFGIIGSISIAGVAEVVEARSSI